jgi:hypothetical protein
MYKEPNNLPRNGLKTVKRELKVTRDTENKKNSNVKDYSDVDNMLKTITKKFMNEPVSLESLNKQYSEISEKKNPIKEHTQKKGKVEKAIFYDIFIKPKEVKINEIRDKRQLEKKTREDTIKKKQDLNNPSLVGPSNKKKVVGYFSGKMKGFLNKIKKADREQNIENLFGIENDSKFDSKQLFVYLSNKFTPSLDGNNKGNFFNQLIQIKPPEGINAVVASPLMECNFF